MRVRQHPQDFMGDGEVMRQQCPDRVNVAMGCAPADAPGAHRPDFAERAGARVVAKRLDAGMVAPLVHHEDALAGNGNQSAGGIGTVGERFFDEDRPSRPKQIFNDDRVGRGRRCHDEAVDRVRDRQSGVKGHALPSRRSIRIDTN